MRRLWSSRVGFLRDPIKVKIRWAHSPTIAPFFTPFKTFTRHIPSCLHSSVLELRHLGILSDVVAWVGLSAWGFSAILIIFITETSSTRSDHQALLGPRAGGLRALFDFDLGYAGSG